MGHEKGIVGVTGAAGFIGSWLVMRLLEQGYTVKATVRDPNNMKKVKHLLDLPHASNKLTLWKADLEDEGSFDEAVHGCVGVFHVATPMDFESSDPENEVIKPTVDGMLNVLRSCANASTVRRVVFTSSAGTVGVQEQRKSVYDEGSWSDVDFCRAKKMTGWMYFVSKTLAERAAWEFCKENNLDFISIIPTLVNGPFIMPTMPPSMLTALALITSSAKASYFDVNSISLFARRGHNQNDPHSAGNTPHYSILNAVQFVHLDDLCMAHIFLFEHSEAKGRYICSSHDTTISRLAEMLRQRYPEYDIPTEFEGIEEAKEITHFSSKKLLNSGFKFKYSLEDMYDGAIRSCREKGLLPLTTHKEKPKEEVHGHFEQENTNVVPPQDSGTN